MIPIGRWSVRRAFGYGKFVSPWSEIRNQTLKVEVPNSLTVFAYLTSTIHLIVVFRYSSTLSVLTQGWFLAALYAAFNDCNSFKSSQCPVEYSQAILRWSAPRHAMD